MNRVVSNTHHAGDGDDGSDYSSDVQPMCKRYFLFTRFNYMCRGLPTWQLQQPSRAGMRVLRVRHLYVGCWGYELRGMPEQKAVHCS